MFSYCVGELHYSEANAYRRLQASEATRKFPEVLSLIKDGGLTVCALAVIAKHLTRENSSALLKRIEGKSVRAVETFVAELAPKPDTRDLIRTVPSAPAAAAPSAAPVFESAVPATAPAVESAAPAAALVIESAAPTALAGPAAGSDSPTALPAVLKSASPAVHFSTLPPDRIIPRASDRALFRFTGSAELRRVIDRCRDLLWHKHPMGRLEDILLEASNHYLRMRDPELLPESKPKSRRAASTRTVVRWVRSIVYRRDHGQCAFVSDDGRRCESRRALEYDHIVPWALGGRSDDPGNIRLLCRAHNQSAARAAGLL